MSGRFHYTWPKVEWNTCTPSWDIVLVAEVGKVTSTTVEVRAVTAKFYPTAGNQLVPSTLDVWSNQTANKRISDDAFLIAFDPGRTHRYEVNKTFTVDAKGPATIQLHAAGGIPGGDITDLECERTPSLQILPSTIAH